MESDYSNYWKGTFVPILNQLRSMIAEGFQFDSTIVVSNSRKPRDNNGHELPDNLSDPENDGNSFIMKNPILPGKQEVGVQPEVVVNPAVVVKEEVTPNPEFPAPHGLGYGPEVAQPAPEVETSEESSRN